MIKEIILGIDQSYEDTGLALIVDGVVKNVSCETFNGCGNNTEKRQRLQERLCKVVRAYRDKTENMVFIFEQIRLKSQGFISMDYIIAMAGMTSIIIDIGISNNIKVYSVDTRSWKSKVVGTSKPKDNIYGLDPKKYPTLEWAVAHGYKKYLIKEVSPRKKKGIILEENGRKYTYDDNKADSICIGLYYYCDGKKLKEEH